MNCTCGDDSHHGSKMHHEGRPTPMTELTEAEQELQEFADRLASQQEDIPPEFQKVIDDHFWELLEE